MRGETQLHFCKHHFPLSITWGARSDDEQARSEKGVVMECISTKANQ